MDDTLLTIVGTAAALATISSFGFQILKIWRTRDASGVSLKMYAFTVTAFTLWTVYGAGTGAWPLVVANSVSLVLSATALFLKWRFRDGDPDGEAQAAEKAR